MDKLKVGIVMEGCTPLEGGGYSYYQTLLSAIDRFTFSPDIEVININFDKPIPGNVVYNKRVIYVKKNLIDRTGIVVLKLLYKIVHRLLKNNGSTMLDYFSKVMDAIDNRAAKKILEAENIKLVYYLKPKENLLNYPMIVTHWDVGHKSMYPFPEVAWNKNFEKRENYYQKILSKAFLILCESESGAKELQYYFPVNPKKIRVLPYFSGDVVKQNVPGEKQAELLASYALQSGKFYLYPAQFWSHKNHSTLIHAFRCVLQQTGDDSLKLVLCGGDQGNLPHIKNLISRLELGGNIILPGFISIEALFVLYKNAIALVMPTFLGPTNLPLIEAAELKCAIMCSNLDGHKEILGENALFFDPSSIVEISGCMQQLLDTGKRNKLIDGAYLHIKNSPFTEKNSLPLLNRFLTQVNPVRNTWGIKLQMIVAFAKIGILSLT